MTTDDWVKAAAVLVASLGAAYTAIQYHRGRKWRAGDLAIAYIALLETDDELAFACHIIDWGVGPLVVPRRYQVLVQSAPADPAHPTAYERGELIDLDLRLLKRAVNVSLSVDPWREPAGLIYRYCFDKLFTHMANIQRLLEAKQLDVADLDGLVYWLKRLETYEYDPDDDGQSTFQPFLKHEPFGYSRVIKLAERLRVSGWSYEF